MLQDSYGFLRSLTTLVDHNTCPVSSIAAAWCASFPASTPTHTLVNLGPPGTTPPGPLRTTSPTVPLPATSAQISISGQGAPDWLGDDSSTATQRHTTYSHTQPTQRPEIG